MNTNTIIVYFSHKGENYVNGSIVSLKKGNTEVVAEAIGDLLQSPTFQIESEQPYPNTYQETTEVTKKEWESNARPALTSSVSLTSIDTIYLGYPNWWGTMPMAVFTFLEEHDLTNKTIYPFCTHEGSKMGHSLQDLAKYAKGAVIKDSLAIKGSDVLQSAATIKNWVMAHVQTKG